MLGSPHRVYGNCSLRESFLQQLCKSYQVTIQGSYCNWLGTLYFVWIYLSWHHTEDTNYYSNYWNSTNYYTKYWNTYSNSTNFSNGVTFVFMLFAYRAWENFGGANHEPFAKIFLANIHRYTENVLGICTDFSLFTKFFLTNSFYLYSSPKFSCVQYIMNLATSNFPLVWRPKCWWHVTS